MSAPTYQPRVGDDVVVTYLDEDGEPGSRSGRVAKLGTVDLYLEAVTDSPAGPAADLVLPWDAVTSVTVVDR
jgi:hypothetical protein